MINCGRCGKAVNLDYFNRNRFMVTEYIRDLEQKRYAACSYLCDECNNSLKKWLNEGDYKKNHGPAIPCKGRYSDMIGHKLLNLKGERLEVWKVDDGKICVKYSNCEVKDGVMLKGVFGEGITFEEACDDYYKQISGKTLVFTYGENSQKEVTVL